MHLISSTSSDVWHLAKVKESRGERTGRLISTYEVAACSGRQLGGVWGYSKIPLAPVRTLCARCERILHKQHGVTFLRLPG